MEITAGIILTLIIQIITIVWYLSKQNTKVENTKKELENYKKEMKEIVENSFEKHDQHDKEIKELKTEILVQQTIQSGINKEILNQLKELNISFNEVKEIIQILKDDNLANKLYHKICPYYNKNLKKDE